MSEFNMNNIKPGSIADIALRSLSQKSAGQAIADGAATAIKWWILWRLFIICLCGLFFLWLCSAISSSNVAHQAYREKEFPLTEAEKQDIYARKNHLGIYKYLGVQ